MSVINKEATYLLTYFFGGSQVYKTLCFNSQNTANHIQNRSLGDFADGSVLCIFTPHHHTNLFMLFSHPYIFKSFETKANVYFCAQECIHLLNPRPGCLENLLPQPSCMFYLLFFHVCSTECFLSSAWKQNTPAALKPLFWWSMSVFHMLHSNCLLPYSLLHNEPAKLLCFTSDEFDLHNQLAKVGFMFFIYAQSRTVAYQTDCTVISDINCRTKDNSQKALQKAKQH